MAPTPDAVAVVITAAAVGALAVVFAAYPTMLDG